MAVALLARRMRDVEQNDVSAEDLHRGSIHHFINVIVPPLKLGGVVSLVGALPIKAGPRV